MTCGSPHPERPVTCKVEGTHADHSAWVDGAVVVWPNESYVPPPPRETRARQSQARDRFLDAARRVEPERRTPADPVQPHSWLRHEPHDTERRAADASQVRNSSRRKQVLRAIVEAGDRGMTYDEIAVHLNDVHVPAPRVASRGKELWDGGWIEPATTEAGEQVERQTRAGNGAIVWVLTEGGRGEVGPWLWEDDTSGPDARSAPARRADRLRDEGLRLTELPG